MILQMAQNLKFFKSYHFRLSLFEKHSLRKLPLKFSGEKKNNNTMLIKLLISPVAIARIFGCGKKKSHLEISIDLQFA